MQHQVEALKAILSSPNVKKRRYDFIRISNCFNPFTGADFRSHSPIVRISKGRFKPARYEEVLRLAEASAEPLVPALKKLQGLLDYFAGVGRATNTFLHVSISKDLESAKQMDTLAPMLVQRPIMERARVQFDKIANYEPLWEICTKDWQ